ncbi:MAG: hypothetical protein LUG13_10005 [Oscillospiraceae bacterium]|nr:hypothetical protein [Oscillospiraceae bacterium]
MLHDGLVCAIAGVHAGVTADNLAKESHITRQEQDALAVLSHQRAACAIEEGMFVQEIVPVTVTQTRKETIVTQDAHPRADISLEQLAALKPAFVKDGTGTVTAGNASSVNDGAAALVLASETAATKLGCTGARILVSLAFQMRRLGCRYGLAALCVGSGPSMATILELV